MKDTSKPSAKKEIEKGAISLGGGVTVREMETPGKFAVHYRGVYTGYVTSNGEPRLKEDTPEEVSERVTSWAGSGTGSTK